MAELYFWLLFFAEIEGASLGYGECTGPDVTVFVAPGGSVLLQLDQSERALCTKDCQLLVMKNSAYLVTKTDLPKSEARTNCRPRRHNCHVFSNGGLELSNVTLESSGNYSVTLRSDGKCKLEKFFRVHIQDPVSAPQVSHTCQDNVSVHLSCLAENGTDPSYSWHVDGTSAWTHTKDILTDESMLRHVTCTVKNKVSEKQSEPTDVTCPEGASLGYGECTGPEVTVFVAPGGSVLLQLDQSERSLCPEKCQLQVMKNSTYLVTKTDLPTSEARTECRPRRHNCQVFSNGSLELSNVIPDVSGNYSVTLQSDGTCKLEKFFRVHIQDPVSAPQVSHTCQDNVSVHLSCLAENGTDPSYSWHVDGTSAWTHTKDILTDESMLRHVTCTVKNKVSEKQSEPTDVTCPEGASLGYGECTGPDVTVFVAPGGSVLLQLDQSERSLCTEKCQLQVMKNSTYPVTKTDLPTSEARTKCRYRRHNCHVLTNGSLELSNVTPDVLGNYRVTLRSDGTCKLEKFFRVHIQDPVSVPQVNYTCQRNSSVHLSCLAENGTDPSYSWHVDVIPAWRLTKEILIEYESVLRNVTCTAKNHVSKEQSEPTDITCSGASSGAGECKGSDVTVFVAPGGSVLLQLEKSERDLCTEKCLLQVTQNSTYLVTKIDIPTSEARTECRYRRHNCHVLTNGSLELLNVTLEISGNYTVHLESDRTCKLEKFFRVHIQVVPADGGDAIFVLRLVSAAIVLVAMSLLIRWHLA